MSKNSRYFIQDGVNFLDFSDPHAPEVSLAGQTIAVKGTNQVDVVYVGDHFQLDFTESLLGVDLLLVNRLSSEFTAAVSGTTLKLTRREDVNDYLIVGRGDKLVFLDGSMDVDRWYSAVSDSVAVPVPDANENANGSVDALAQRFLANQTPSSLVLAFGGGTESSTFAQVQKGMRLTIKGTNTDDVVYVKQGTVVDFTESLLGVDKIYLTGRWTDYTKAISGNTLQLYRGSEAVSVSQGDLLFFADGSVLVNNVLRRLPGNPTSAELGADWDPNNRTPGLGPRPGVLSLAADFEDTGVSSADAITRDDRFSLSLEGQDAGSNVIYQQNLNNSATWTDLPGASLSALVDGHYQFRAKVSNADGESFGNVVQVTVDRTAPSLSLALASDSGISGSDGISRHPTVLVSGLENGATWAYSLNAKDASPVWQTGVGSQFTLAEGLQPLQSVAVRQTDVAGNSSTPASNASAWRIDLADDPATGTLTLPVSTRTGRLLTLSVGELSDPDGGTIVPDTYQWEYREAGSSSWVHVDGGTSASFNIPQSDAWGGRALRVKVRTSPDPLGGSTVLTSTESQVLNQAQGFVIHGECAGDRSGASVSLLGDVNGDGLADLLVGASGSDAALPNAGRAYVVWGKATAGAIELSNVAAGTGGFAITGQSEGDSVGWAAAALGDLNGDGLADLIVTAQEADVSAARSNAGRSYVVFGKTDGSTVDLAQVVAGTGGYVINGIGPQNFSGHSVSPLGDLDGDGLPDLLIGALSGDEASSAGRAYVLWGKTDTAAVELSDVQEARGGLAVTGYQAADRAGYSVAGVGDVNGDGMSDLLIGAPDGLDAQGIKTGRAYLVFGTSSWSFSLSRLEDDVLGFAINGESMGDQAGVAVSGIGDVNGDGLADLAIGAKGSDRNGEDAGRVYVLWGKTTTTPLDLSQLVQSGQGYVIEGASARDHAGVSVASAGDVNGDGLPDLLIGADGPTGSDVGNAYVVWGKTDSQRVFLSAVAAGTGGFVIQGVCRGDGTGTLNGLSGGGDVNGDGLADLMVGAPGSDRGARGDVGRSHVVFGKTDGTPVFLSELVAGRGVALSTHFSGTEAANSWTGTPANEQALGGAGDDTLEGGGGIDVLEGGPGQDVIIINASNIAGLLSRPLARDAQGNLQWARVDGGTGLDTLRMAQDAGNLSLSALTNNAVNPNTTNRITGIEIFDLSSDTGANTLTLSAQDVQMLGQRNLFNSLQPDWTNQRGTPLQESEYRYQLAIKGGANDALQGIDADHWVLLLDGSQPALARWHGTDYMFLQHRQLPVQVLVSSTVSIAPDAAHVPSMALASDTGTSQSDGFTRFAQVNVSGLLAGATWEYTFNGHDWEPVWYRGSGSSFTLPEGHHAAFTVGVRQTDAAGRITFPYTQPIDWTFDPAEDPATATISYRGTGRIGQVIEVSVDALKDPDGGGVEVATYQWQYRVGNGVWTDVPGASSSAWLIPDHPDWIGRSLRVRIETTEDAFGQATTLFGDETLATARALGFALLGARQDDESGASVHMAGDINGDGLADLLVSAPNADLPNASNAGRTYVVWGKPTATAIDLSAVASGTGGFVINGTHTAEQAGVPA